MRTAAPPKLTPARVITPGSWRRPQILQATNANSECPFEVASWLEPRLAAGLSSVFILCFFQAARFFQAAGLGLEFLWRLPCLKVTLSHHYY